MRVRMPSVGCWKLCVRHGVADGGSEVELGAETGESASESAERGLSIWASATVPYHAATTAVLTTQLVPMMKDLGQT